MAKASIAELISFSKTYVDKSLTQATWDPTKGGSNLSKLLNKVGIIKTIDGEVIDKLALLDGEHLPFGKTIEEYFVDFTLPTRYGYKDGVKQEDPRAYEGSKDLEPACPEFEDTVYSYSLGRIKYKTTVPYDEWERGCLNASDAANVAGKVISRFTQSVSMGDYFQKKQLLGNLASKAIDAGCSADLAIPEDTATGEAFIKDVKKRIQDSSFVSEGDTIATGVLHGATPSGSLVLFVKKGVAPSLEVDTLAGAIDGSKLNLPVREITVDDFGSVILADGTTDKSDNVYAILADERGIKFHNGYDATRNQINADGDFENFVRHKEDTAFLSKYTYVHVYTKA